MDEITIGDKTYISSKQAAKITGYAKDYVGQLCREGRVEARLVGRNWYVLDSAIKEHRFGKEAEEASVKEPEAPVDRVSTWQKPQYIPETPAYVPELPPKPLETVGSPAIADMQSAWREWFEEKQQPVAALPDGSEDFRDEYLPVIVPEEAPVAESRPVEEPIAPVEEKDHEEMVVISRIRHQEEPASEVTEAAEPALEGNVELHRSYTTTNSPRREYEAEVVSIKTAPVRPPATLAKDSAAEKSTSGVTRALLIVLSLIAVTVAIIGTGNAEQLLSGTSLDFGAQKEVVDFLGGKSTYESAL